MAYIIDGDSKIDSGLASAAFLLLHVGFAGTIGEAGSALTNSTNGGIYYYGTGAYAYFANVGTLRVWSTGGGTVYISGSDFSTKTIQLGPSSTVVFEADAINMGTVYSYPTCDDFRICGAGVTIKNGSVAGGAIKFEARGGAVVNCARQMGSIGVHGRGSLVTYSNNASVTAIEVHDDAVYIHESSGTIGTLTMFPRSTAIDRGSGPFTVTDRVLYPNVKCFESPRNVITYTNAAGHVCWP